jgi:hypothetical protein
MLRKKSLPFPGCGLARISAILIDVPFERAHVSEKIIQSGFVGYEFAKQVAWVPIEQDPAQVKNNRSDHAATS